MRTLYVQGFGAAQEAQADQEGVLYAARAGYDVGAMTQVLQSWAKAPAQDMHWQLLRSTHAPPFERLARLQPLLQRLATTDSGVGQAQAARYLAMRNQLP